MAGFDSLTLPVPPLYVSCDQIGSALIKIQMASGQHIVVMRHGERLDDADPAWTSPRPWDPPLTDIGLQQARKTGHDLGQLEGLRIAHVFCSPFKRCWQGGCLQSHT